MSEGSIARYVAGVLLAAVCWGTIGTSYMLFERWFDVDELTIVTIRSTSAAVILGIWWSFRQTVFVMPSRRELAGIALLGFVAVTCFYLALIYAFTYTSVSVATLLLYLAPTIVSIGAALFLNEPLTRPRVLALMMSLIGCGFIVEVYRPSNLEGNVFGIALCLVAAGTYASYSLLAKPLLGRVASDTMILGHLIFGAAGLVVIKLVVSPLEWPELGGILLIGAHAGVVLTLIPIISYTYGLRGLPTGEASTIATLEPVVAMLLAAMVLGERLAGLQLFGATCAWERRVAGCRDAWTSRGSGTGELSELH